MPNDISAKVHLADTKDLTEWSTDITSNRIDDISWINRYKHEALIINNIIETSNVSKILELGSGPGELSNYIYNIVKNKDLEYHLVDKPVAKDIFEQKRYRGKFFIKDMSDGLDTSDLDSSYDMVIANDFLEHIFNPSHILRESHKLLCDNGLIMTSIPNWRMGHSWVYRGLFDYDNWKLCMEYHNFQFIGCWKSNLMCQYYPKSETEKTMPDGLIQSWNWYMLFKKINI
jgi:2-polyprenyl-3-methyl-5-hydroxy-6-metoxy-1,4-benzoquinol methylase